MGRKKLELGRMKRKENHKEELGGKEGIRGRETGCGEGKLETGLRSERKTENKGESQWKPGEMSQGSLFFHSTNIYSPPTVTRHSDKLRSWEKIIRCKKS